MPNVNSKYARLVLWAGVGMSLLAPSCDTEFPGQNTSPKHCLDEIERVFCSQDPRGLDPQASSQLFSRLITACQTGGMAADEDSAKRVLIERFADSDIGLFVLNAWVEQLSLQSPAEALALAQSISSQFLSSPVGAKAFDLELRSLRLNQPSVFLDRCKKSIEDLSNRRYARVALLRRTEFYSAVRETKAAAIDGISFWHLFPDEVTTLNLRVRLLANLERAGFLLESGLLGGDDNALASDFLQSEMVRVFHETATGETTDKALATYIQVAPDVPVLAESAVSSTDPVQNTIMAARWACLSRSKEQGANLHTRYIDALRDLLAKSEISDKNLEFVSAIDSVLLTGIKGLLDQKHNARSSLSIGIPDWVSKAPSLLTRLSEQHVALTSRRIAVAEVQSSQDTVVAAIFDQCISILQAIDQPEQVINAYKQFLEKHARFSLAPKYLLDYATYYYDRLDAHKAAADLLMRIVDAYPASDAAPAALIKMASISTEAKDFGDAYLQFQRFLSSYKGHPLEVNAIFGLGICERSLGLNDLAEQHLIEVTREFPTSTFAPQALSIVGNWRLAERRYDIALESFQELLERFPQSPQSEDAKGYVLKLTDALRESATNRYERSSDKPAQ